MKKSNAKHSQFASGGTDTASGGAGTVSGAANTNSGHSELGLDKYIHERKYRNRPVFNNWGRYNESEIVNAEHAAGMKNDFADLLNLPSDCNFFQFKWEKNWDSEAARRTFSCQEFFNLNLEVLSHGLECLPFYERVRMDKNALPQSDIEKCDVQVSKALEKYTGIKENFVKELEENEKLSQSFEDLTGIKWEPKKTAPNVIEPEPAEEPDAEEDTQAPQLGKFWLSHRTELKEIGGDSYLAPSSSSEESLELWLDSILDG